MNDLIDKKQKKTLEEITMKPSRSFCVYRQAGFTVIEVMVSLSILTLTLIAIYQSFGVSLFVISSTENLWKAMSYSQNELYRWERSFDSKVSVAQGEFDEKIRCMASDGNEKLMIFLPFQE